MGVRFLKYFLTAALLSLMLMPGLFGKPVEPGEAREVAENWIQYIIRNDGSWGSFRDAEAVKIEPFFVEGALVGYVIDVAPVGFVLVPSDDELPPVKAFSTDSFFNPESKGFAEWLGAEMREMSGAMRKESSARPVFLPINALLWEKIRKPDTLEAGPVLSALPAPVLTTTSWDQVNPYNLFCPEVDGQKCPVGCVATASAQLMRYWSWPPQGTGSHSYNWSGQTLTADFNHAYIWENMPDSLGFGSTTEQKEEISRLGSDLGIAFEMSYDPEGSGAYTRDAYIVLPKYFYYSNEASYEGYNTSDEYWFNLFKAEIDKGRPALMSIRGDAGGHSVVVDGYRTDSGNMIHLNFGWGGTYTAYYAHDNIAPGGNDFTWKQGQEIVKNLFPTELTPVGAGSSATPMGGKAPVTVSFAGQGKKGLAPYSYEWDFGDGSTGGGQYTTHVYGQPGSYQVTLKVTDSESQTATDDHLSITVTSSTGLSAAAQADLTSGKAPLTVNFTAVAQGGTPSYSYIWNFGDGSSETTSNTTISHTYTTAGTFTAILTVKDSVGQQTTATALTITVAPAVPPPVISSVTKLTSPFRLRIMGSNFLQGAKVKIDGVAVSQTLFKKSTKLIAKGSDVKAMCPKGVTVKVTVDNGDGGISAEFSYTR